MKTGKKLQKIYTVLLHEYGHRNWWPAETSFEVIIGAILTQNVSWKNVEIAINNLKEVKLLDAEKLYRSETDTIAPLIKSSRYYNQKAKKIKNFMDFFYTDYNGSLERMSLEESTLLRNKLLKIKGLGEETVDSILLYSCNKPIFVVDAYTKRIFSRFGLIEEMATYREIQHFFMENLPQDIVLFNDFHAQIVHLGNKICKTHPECTQCPIRKIDGTLKCRYPVENHS
jgi:endonuclease III related protein